MKKGFLTAAFALLALCAFCQTQAQPVTETVSYRIDYYKPDSLYLVEVKAKQTAPNLRPETTETPVFMNDVAQVQTVLDNLGKKAEEAAKAARDYVQISNEINGIYQQLKARLGEKNNQ